MFQNPTKMCFALNFFMIEWLLKVKSIVEQTIIDPKWTTFVNMLRSIDQHKFLIKARYVKPT